MNNQIQNFLTTLRSRVNQRSDTAVVNIHATPTTPFTGELICVIEDWFHTEVYEFNPQKSIWFVVYQFDKG